ncbi:diacylglycerol kinase [Clostridium sp.]|uniref:diacylglycerol kinase n=1 Tax=Clostridium sp. TaxID=1506 RepID=UPI003217B97A
MKVKKLVDSFNYAIEGIIYSIRTQRNMRIHMIITMLVLIGSFFFDLTKIELLILTITITMVVVAEMINTAVECAIDATTNFYHPLAKIAKNVAAGAVLITALNAILVAYIIFYDKVLPFSLIILSKIKNSNPHMIFFMLVIVCIATVVVKAIYDEGTPLRGGMPSGHSSIAFAIATTITLLTTEPLIMILAFLLAFIVAQSRVDSDVHSILEVVLGGAFGSLLILFLYQIIV